jgi:YfiR/HmsC-like
MIPFGWICRFCIIVVMLGLSISMMGTADAANLEADTVKAAFVLNFARYTQWPEQAFASPADPIELWVLGGETTRRAFETIDAKTVGSRKLRVRFMQSAQAADSCHMIFVSRDMDRSIWSAALAAIGNRPVLTVGEMPEFIRFGGIINIFSKKGRFHFEIQPEAARRQGLKISSRLLKLAIITGD